jgi:cytoskeletal protein RodZ
VNSTEASVRARDLAVDRLNELTALIAVGAVAALGVFAFIAAATIPGKTATNQSPSTPTATTGSSTSTNTSSFLHHRHRDSGSVSVSSGTPVAVTGGSH